MLFDFNKRGGSKKWSLFHLASCGGFLSILEILNEAGVNPFIENSNGKTPRCISVQSLVIWKMFRKFENDWIQKNIVHKSNFMRFQEENNVFKIKVILLYF